MTQKNNPQGFILQPKIQKHFESLAARARYWVAQSLAKGIGDLPQDIDSAIRLLKEAYAAMSQEKTDDILYGITADMVQEKLEEYLEY